MTRLRRIPPPLRFTAPRNPPTPAPTHVDARTLGLLIVAAGLILVVVGVLVAAGAMNWFGRLPGDIRIEGESTRVYIPLASMILVSVVLTVLLHVFRRLF